MRLEWKEPSINIQKFEANEYISACVTGTIACAIPGQSPYEINDGTGPCTFNGSVWYGAQTNWTGAHWGDGGDGLSHGICGETTSISFDSGDATGYEMNNGRLDRTRKIYGISGYTLDVGNHNVIWYSKQDGSSYTYKHYGTLQITNIDDDHPNRS